MVDPPFINILIISAFYLTLRLTLSLKNCTIPLYLLSATFKSLVI